MERDYLSLARSAALSLGIDFDKERFTINDLAKGIEVEYEHGHALSAANCGRPDTNVTEDDPLITAKIALAHLYERREDLGGGQCGDYSGRDTQYDYYDGLELVETAPIGYWRGTSPKTYWKNKKTGFYVLLGMLATLLIIWADTLGIITLPREIKILFMILASAKVTYLLRIWK